MGVIRVKVRCYAEIENRILTAVGKSERLTVRHKGFTTPTTESSDDTSYPLYCLYYSSKQRNAPLFYVSAGIHGDEPAGVECATRLIEQVTTENTLSDYPFQFHRYNWLISPCDNPYGYVHNCRENTEGLDLNRMFESPNMCSETAFIAETLLHSQCEQTQNSFLKKDTMENFKIRLALDLHEDKDSDGFYLWERRASEHPSVGDAVVNDVAEICAINRTPIIEDHLNENGVLTLLDTVTTKGWTRGRYLIEQVNIPCLILETPTALEFEKRIDVHMMAIQTAIKAVVS